MELEQVRPPKTTSINLLPIPNNI